MIHEQNELVKPSGRYVQLPDCILKDMDNDGEDGLVTLGIYISIANAAFNHRVNKITAKTIGENVHRSERTAQRHIKRLVERGRIEIVEANGKVLTIKDLAGMENDTVRTAKKSDTSVQEHDTSVADTHVASPVTTPMSQARDTSVAENPLVVEHKKSAPPSSSITSYMHEEQLAIKQLSMSASNSEDMNSCNSRQEEEVFEKLEEEDSFKNSGEQDGMRDLLTQVSKDHMPKFHIPTSGEHDDEHDGMGDSPRESMSHGPKTSEAPKRRIKQWEKWRSVEKPILEIPPDELRSSMPENSLAKIHLSPNHPLEKVNAMKERALDTLVESELLTIGQCHAFLYGDFRKQPDIERQGAWIAGLLKRMVRNRKGQATVAQFFACCKQARRPGCPQTDLSIVESLIPNAELVGSK